MPLEFEEDIATQSMGDYLSALRRRKFYILIPAIIVLIIAIAIAVLWPPTYKSSATILIEEQEIPQDLVRSTITSYAVQQIQVIKARTMTMPNILDIANKFELFTDYEFKTKSKSEITEVVRKSVSVQLITADVIDPRSGQPTQATIAFELAFEHSNAVKAQKVANELVNLYLNENLKSRAEKTQNTSSFLKTESTVLEERLTKIDTRVAAFKRENERSMPGLYSFNLNNADRAERELVEISYRRQELEKQKINIKSRLSQLDKSAPVILATGQAVLGEADRLKALRTELREKSAVYSDGHPDVIRLRREIDSLLSVVGDNTDKDGLIKKLKTESNALAHMQGQYTADHPKQVKQRRLVSSLESELESIVMTASDESEADNPAYVMLEAQLYTVESELKGLIEKSASVKAKIAAIEELLLKAPAVENEYQQILREQENTSMKLQDIRLKLMVAETAENLELDRKGERFTLIDPPATPVKPASPNRVAIMVTGFMIALVIGVGVAVLAEILDPAIRGGKSLGAVIGEPIMIVIPYMLVDEEILKKKKLYRNLFIGVFALGILTVILFHFFVKPLDVTWFMLMRKLGLS